MKNLLTILGICLSASLSFGQGVRVGDDLPVAQVQSVAGIGANIVTAIPSASVNFCSAPANAVPCTNKALTYTDSTLSTVCASSTQLTIGSNSNCVGTTDSQGNWGVWVAAGQYAYTVTVNGASSGPFPITAGSTGNAGGGTVLLFRTNSPSCTTLNAFVEFDTANLDSQSRATVKTATLSSKKVIGVLVSGAGCSGTAQIATSLTANVLCDNQCNVGDFVSASSTVLGQADDYGASKSSAVQTRGIVSKANTGAGTMAEIVMDTGDQISSGSSGGSGNVNPAPQFKMAYYSQPGSTAVISGDVCTTDGSGNPICPSFTTSGAGAGIVTLATGSTPALPSAGFLRFFGATGGVSSKVLACIDVNGVDCLLPFADMRRFAGASVGAQIDAGCASFGSNQGAVVLPATVGAGNSLVGLSDNCRFIDFRGLSGPNQYGDEARTYTKDILFRSMWTVAAVNNQTSQALHTHATAWAGGSNQVGGNGKTTYASNTATLDAHTQGQHYGYMTKMFSGGDGDAIGFEGDVFCAGGTNSSGDQGCQGMSITANQYGATDFTATVTAVSTNLITYNTAVNDDLRGETGTNGMRRLIATNRAYVTGTVSSIAGTPPTVVGSGTSWAGLTGTYCFMLDNGNSLGTGKYLIPVSSFTDNTHAVLNYQSLGANASWNGDASTGAYHLYPCSSITALTWTQEPATTNSLTVAAGSTFLVGDTVEEPPSSAISSSGAAQFSVAQELPSGSFAGVTINNIGTRIPARGIYFGGKFNHFLETNANLNGTTFAQFSGAAGPSVLFADLDPVDNSFLTLFSITRNVAEGGTFNYTYDKSVGSLAFNGAKKYAFNGFDATTLDFNVSDGTAVPRLRITNGSTAWPMGKPSVWYSDNQGVAKAEIDGSNGFYRSNSLGLYTWTSANADQTIDTGFSRDSAGVIDAGNGTQGNKSGSINLTGLTATGQVSAATYVSATNCASTGGTCAAAPAGAVTIAAAATTVTVSTTAVTANSQILLSRDNSLGTRLSVTCNTQSSLVLGMPYVSARTAGTSFVVTLDVAPTTNPLCLNYSIVN